MKHRLQRPFARPLVRVGFHQVRHGAPPPAHHREFRQLFAPIVGFIAPSQVGILPSIAFLIGVAIGGRTTLLGPVLGAIGVAWAQTLFSERFPSEWTYAQGLLFIVVVGFFPAGLAGLGVFLKRRRKAKVEPPPEKATDSDPDTEKVGASS